jgi:hypothetical protein
MADLSAVFVADSPIGIEADDALKVDQDRRIWLTSMSIPCKKQNFQVFLERY